MFTRFIAFLSLLLATTWLAHASEANPARMEAQAHLTLAEQAVKLARVPETFALQEKSARQRAMEDSRLEPGERQRVAELLVKWMDSPRELARIAVAIRQQCDVQALTRFNEANSTPVAVKLYVMALQASDVDEQANLKAFVAKVKTMPPDQQRVRLLLRLDELTNTSKIGADSLLETTARMSRVQPGSPRYRQMEEKIREQVADQMFMLMLFAFRQATNEELRAFVDLYEDPLVAKVASVLNLESMNGVQNMLDRIVESAVIEGRDVMSSPAEPSR